MQVKGAPDSNIAETISTDFDKKISEEVGNDTRNGLS